MYIRITSRCNMQCKHCCYSCTEHGEDMSRETFIKACRIAFDNNDSIFIGGGEPTLHPLLFDFIGIAMSYNNHDIPVGMVINGKLKEPAQRLALMAKAGLITCDLSNDMYHEKIDPVVIKMFTKEQVSHYTYHRDYNDRDYRTIRERSNPVKIGRAEENELSDREGCCCEDVIVEPDGKMYYCGCRKPETHIGDLNGYSYYNSGKICFFDMSEETDE